MSVQNFSLPSRAGSRCVCLEDKEKGKEEEKEEKEDGKDQLPPVALRLFRFPSDVSARPISTSSSAPVLTAPDTSVYPPNSPHDSLWPHLQLALVLQPVHENRASANSHDRLLPVRSLGHSWSLGLIEDAQPVSPSSPPSPTIASPTPRSISVRCGPRRRRHLSLSAAEAAHDQARRRAAARRRRLLAWLLAALVAAALLSTMAAAGAAATVSPSGHGPWKTRTVAWLGASLAVAAAAGMALAVLVWQRQPADKDKPLELTDQTAMNNTTETTTRQEDHNWARFAADPVRLRRYVEGLEERLAGGLGTLEQPSSGETSEVPLGLAITTDSSDAVRRHSHYST